MSDVAKLSAEDAAGDNSVAERILAAAREVFMEHGFSGATTDMIQVASGASKSTIYRYFPSKEILFHRSLDPLTRAFLPKIKTLILKDESLSAFLNEFGFEFMESLLSQEGIDICRLMIAESQRFPQLGRSFYRMGPKPITDLVEQRLATAHAQGEIEVGNPAVAAEHFIGMVRGDLHLRCLLGERTPSDAQLKRFVAATVDVFIAAYQPGR